uniref:Reticulon n=1 Tax=Monodelphis domestica TaxID=13616 RepID=A0A5F8GGE7_MONDO
MLFTGPSLPSKPRPALRFSQPESRQTGRRVLWLRSLPSLCFLLSLPPWSGRRRRLCLGAGGWRGAEQRRAAQLRVLRQGGADSLFRQPQPPRPCPPLSLSLLSVTPHLRSSRPQPEFKYQFVREPEDEEEEEEEEEEEDEDEDLEELEVLERKPAAGMAAVPLPVNAAAVAAAAAAAPLLDFETESVPPAPRGPLPAVPPAAPERQPRWEPSPVSSSSPSPPPSAAASLEEDEPPSRPPPPPPTASVDPHPDPAPPAWTPSTPAPAAPPSTPAAPKRRGSSGSAVVDLLYWRDIKKTGVVFGASLFLLLSLTVFSIVSVTAYIALALLSVTISFRVYKGVIQAIQKSDEGHPFRAYLDTEVAVSEALVQKYSNSALGHVNCTIKELRRLFLVDDLVDSLKFAVLMWIFTYVGALFNGLTLLILALISLFSVPVIYERHQTQIDHYLGLVNKNVKDAMAKIQAKIPGLKSKAE